MLSQEEILSNWNTEVPVVSICCNTFNHKSFIEKALEGFLMQVTTFPFEIVIHDDASTDGTAEVVAAYVKKYPKIFNALLQTENQYSKFKSGMGPRFNYPRTKGKYIALCEGDDYWTDSLKLQKQVDFMEQNQDCSLCSHPSKVVYDNDSKKDFIAGLKLDADNVISSEKIIRGEVFIRTVTILFRSEYINIIPDWFFKAPLGDMTLQLYYASKGNIGYLKDPMSVYRRGVVGSWSEMGYTGNFKKYKSWALKRVNNHITCFDLFDKETEYKYHKLLRERKAKLILIYLFNIQNISNKIEVFKGIAKNFKYLFYGDKSIAVRVLSRFFLGEYVFNKISKAKGEISK